MMRGENAKIAIAVSGQEFRLTKKEARGLVMQIASKLRENFGSGLGRPRKSGAPRCACGQMTLARAKARYHVCPEKN